MAAKKFDKELGTHLLSRSSDLLMAAVLGDFKRRVVIEEKSLFLIVSGSTSLVILTGDGERSLIRSLSESFLLRGDNSSKSFSLLGLRSRRTLFGVVSLSFILNKFSVTLVI